MRPFFLTSRHIGVSKMGRGFVHRTLRWQQKACDLSHRDRALRETKNAPHRHGQRTRPVGLTEPWDWPGATASPVRVCKRATCPVQVADSVRVTGSPKKDEPTAVHRPWRRHRDHSANADHNVKFRMGIPGVTWDEGIFIRVCWIVVTLRSRHNVLRKVSGLPKQCDAKLFAGW